MKTKNVAQDESQILMENLFKKGEDFFSEGKCEEAKQCFLSVLEKDPCNTEALNNLGVIIYGTGNSKAASELFLRVLSIDPHYRDACLNLAHVLRTTNQLKAIEPLLRKLVQRNPQDEEMRNILDEVNLLSHRVSLEIYKAEAFFVLSTGRCGTYTLSKILSLSKKVKMQHSPNPSMDIESVLAWSSDANKSDIFRQKRFPLITAAMEDGFVYGETTPDLTPFADFIAQELPNSKFLVLVRHPYQFVRSALKQNYYQGHPYDSLLLRPSKNSESYPTWKCLSQIEKICWLWAETYSWILEVLSQVNKERYLIVRFEDIQSGSSKIQEIFEFLNIDGYCEQEIAKILEMRLNSQNYGRFPSPDVWSPEIRNIINNRCDSLANQLGYNAEMPPVTIPNPANHPYRRHIPMVSIGFPLYSGSAMLANSLESYLAQDFEDFEIIISDHGSDPMVHEVARHYEKLDHRINYFPTDDHSSCIGVQNFFRVVELSSAPFFIWGSYDDRIEKSYIRTCFEKIQEDNAIALVYTKSKVYQNHTKYIGTGNDFLKADHDDPCERFLHVIWELMMCNAFYGLFRRELLRKTRSFRKDAYAHDNLLLAEVALMGKIIQIDDYLFIRNLTRNYERSFEEHYTDIIRSMDPPWLEEGITLPFCRLTYSHCELINHSSLSLDKKEQLIHEIIRCFRMRWDKQLRYEINRAIQLTNTGCYYYTWDGRHYRQEILDQAKHLQHFYVTNVIKVLSEALFIYPEWEDLRKAYTKCLHTCQESSLGMTNN
jgi:glycosyltransferase involved in cell wall biosynthesis